MILDLCWCILGSHTATANMRSHICPASMCTSKGNLILGQPVCTDAATHYKTTRKVSLWGGFWIHNQVKPCKMHTVWCLPLLMVFCLAAKQPMKREHFSLFSDLLSSLCCSLMLKGLVAALFFFLCDVVFLWCAVPRPPCQARLPFLSWPTLCHCLCETV